MMADENDSDFKHDAMVGIETIAAVVEAYDKGEIELEPVKAGGKGTPTLTLPSGKECNLATIARFLGRVKSNGQATHACEGAFNAYRVRESTQEAL